MALQYSPYAIPALIAGIISAVLAVLIWSRRPGPGVISFVILVLGLMVWAVASGLELITISLPSKIFLTTMSYFGIPIVPLAWFTFVLEYTGREAWLTRRNITLLAIYPVMTVLAVSTNHWHHLFYTQVTLDPTYTETAAVYEHGIFFWLHTACAYSLLLVSSVLLIRAFVRSPQLYRGQIILMGIGVVSPWVANGMYLSGYTIFPAYVDVTPLAFTISVIVAGISLYRFRLLDLLPIAHDAIFHGMVDAVFVFDAKYRIVDANQAATEIVNVPRSQLIGMQVQSLLTESTDLIDRYRDIDRIEDEITFPVKGKTHIYSLRLSPLHNRHGELSGRVAMLHDVTELKEQNEALKVARDEATEATRLKSQFLATMSHELRTPLNAIIGYTDLMLAGLVGELTDTQYQYSERTLANAQHLLGLINDILDISKIEAGRVDIVQEPFYVKEWVDKIVGQNGVLAENKGLKFVSEIDEALPSTLLGDANKLYQIVVNLISNAVKFTESGTVTFKVCKNSNTTWKIIVTDTGIGIAPHDQETIFKEFQQVDGSSTRKFGGTGLGLAIVRKLSLLMGGNVRVSSAVGEGSTFTVILPLVEAKTKATPAES